MGCRTVDSSRRAPSVAAVVQRGPRSQRESGCDRWLTSSVRDRHPAIGRKCLAASSLTASTIGYHYLPNDSRDTAPHWASQQFVRRLLQLHHRQVRAARGPRTSAGYGNYLLRDDIWRLTSRDHESFDDRAGEIHRVLRPHQPFSTISASHDDRERRRSTALMGMSRSTASPPKSVDPEPLSCAFFDKGDRHGFPFEAWRCRDDDAATIEVVERRQL